MVQVDGNPLDNGDGDPSIPDPFDDDGIPEED